MSLDKEHTALIQEAISRLRGGSDRLSVTPIGVNDGIKILSEPPHYIEWDDQDYGKFPKLSEITDQYYEEIEVIETLLNESVLGGEFDTLKKILQEVKNDEHARNRAIGKYAKDLWCYYAIPIRLHNGRVCVVWPPENVLQQPIVHEYNPGEFFASATNTVLEMRNVLESERKNHKKWKTIGIWSLSLLALVVLSSILK